MSTVIAAPAAPRSAHRRMLFMGLSGVMALIALVGFWPRYFGPLVTGALSQPLLIHIHATVFTGWLLLFFLQAAFAATHRLKWHLQLGKIGMWYGLMLIVVGLTTGVLRAADRPADGERLLFVSIADMVMFAGFFGAALLYRRKPHLHRRLMVVAATSILVAAVGRMAFLPAPPLRLPIALFIWSTPVLLAMFFDFKKNRAIHPIYLCGLGVFVVRRLSVGVAQTPQWGSFADWVFSFVAT